MRRSTFARWVVGTLATVPVALAGLSAPAMVGTVLVVLIVVAALCWTITDSGRSQRLAMLIHACRRGGDLRPRDQGPSALPASGPKHVRSSR
jgi:hypothetical protein